MTGGHEQQAQADAAEPVERKLMKALKAGQIKALEYGAQLDEAAATGVISRKCGDDRIDL